jgi:hypothetical protein
MRRNAEMNGSDNNPLKMMSADRTKIYWYRNSSGCQIVWSPLFGAHFPEKTGTALPG